MQQPEHRRPVSCLPLPALAQEAARDIETMGTTPSAPPAALQELAQRLADVASGQQPDSANIINALRLSKRGGLSASRAAMQEYAGFASLRFNRIAAGAATPVEVQKAKQLCGRLYNCQQAVVQRSPRPGLTASC